MSFFLRRMTSFADLVYHIKRSMVYIAQQVSVCLNDEQFCLRCDRALISTKLTTTRDARALQA